MGRSMSRRFATGGLLAVSLVFFSVALVGCGQSNGPSQTTAAPDPATVKTTAFLGDISGVWSARSIGVLTLAYDGQNKTLQVIADDTPIAARLGDVDTQSETANLLVTLKETNKEVVWTLRRVWDASKTTFHLALILNDGESVDLSFIRKIGVDDKNRIANIYKEQEQALSTQRESLKDKAAAELASSAPPQRIGPTLAPAPNAPATPLNSAKDGVQAAVAPSEDRLRDCQATKMEIYKRRYKASVGNQAPERQPSAEQQQATMELAAAGATRSCERELTALATGRPSFDCAKASTAAESLICSDPQLAQLDVVLGNAYAAAKLFAPDKEAIQSAQVEWLKARNECQDVACARKLYDSRISALKAL